MPKYDRELIARMLSCYDGGGYTDQAVAEQIRLLREADNKESTAQTICLSATSAEQREDGAARSCKWWQQDDGYDVFSTSCGHEYQVNDCTDGNVHLPFCPYCARRVQGVAWVAGETEQSIRDAWQRLPKPNWCTTCQRHRSDPKSILCSNPIHLGQITETDTRVLSESPAAALVPDGMVLVPARMELTPENMETLVFMLGGDPDAKDVDERWNGGTLWVGETVGDNGEKYYGLNVANVECYEEGSVPIVEFAAASDHQQNAAQGGGEK